MIEGIRSAEGIKAAVIASRWNEYVVNMLVEGAKRAFRMAGGTVPEIIWVPGTWEIPIAARSAALADYDVIVCVGCILEGATIHAQQLSNSVAAALSELALSTGKPITWGILTCSTQDEAIERAGMKLGNKGEEAANAAIEMASVVRQVGP
ncbi:6,7-dimethyl-8-ribityllumazine synthase [Fimbriimonadia bacterium ATM]|nr:MAG: 6,7-dimethyl-8-ribityllumazine synthase [Armatimonadota bacterium]MBC6970202.1 6,7-dimethyl-8-ribityllumazine synthase [Armatimonadota bacterium]MCE7900605.1 6,7-dimethyl-8-ribityllumazine synthase [Armatimonadetes bacterium ATM1]MDL1929378.1 6,7-dimethyl-8-ribityllumazine synthase [Fimbriimonadia bacterium ATM]RIJ97151.1 MAG: 6,7-dimethyl-8-ribityllumazine synthase [Armatimonadota bacterium]